MGVTSLPVGAVPYHFPEWSSGISLFLQISPIELSFMFVMLKVSVSLDIDGRGVTRGISKADEIELSICLTLSR